MSDGPSAGSSPNREELLDLHKLVVEEIRFEVTLNWQRTQYYFTINTAIIAVAAGLLKINDRASAIVVVALFVVGCVLAYLAERMIKQGHTYYRRAVFKKTLVEHLLGRFEVVDGFTDPAANLAIATTQGMADAAEILRDPKRYMGRKPGPGTVTNLLLWMARIFMIVDGAAAVYAGVIAFRA